LPAPAPQNVSPDSKVFPIVDPVREGYIFDCWYYDGQMWNFDSDRVKNDITLTAKWLKNHIVSFNTDGGLGIPEPQIIPYGGKVAPVPDPARDGYVFVGWYVYGWFSGWHMWSFDSHIVAEDIVLTAEWERIYHNIYFDADGGETYYHTYGILIGDGEALREIEIELETPFRLGYEFLGWYLGDIKWDEAYTVYESFTLSAKWVSAPDRIVYFHTARGASEMQSMVITHGDYLRDLPEPTRRGYIFRGWYAGDKECNYYDRITEDMVLTAKWEKTFMKANYWWISLTANAIIGGAAWLVYLLVRKK